MVSLPTESSDDVVRLAVPPLSVPVPSDVEPEKNVTVPGRRSAAGGVGAHRGRERQLLPIDRRVRRGDDSCRGAGLIDRLSAVPSRCWSVKLRSPP